MAPQEQPKASPAQIAKALKGIEYPKRKPEIVQYAKEHNVDNNPDVIAVLEQIPDREYGNMAELEKSVGQVE